MPTTASSWSPETLGRDDLLALLANASSAGLGFLSRALFAWP